MEEDWINSIYLVLLILSLSIFSLRARRQGHPLLMQYLPLRTYSKAIPSWLFPELSKQSYGNRGHSATSPLLANGEKPTFPQRRQQLHCTAQLWQFLLYGLCLGICLKELKPGENTAHLKDCKRPSGVMLYYTYRHEHMLLHTFLFTAHWSLVNRLWCKSGQHYFAMAFSSSTFIFDPGLFTFYFRVCIWWSNHHFFLKIYLWCASRHANVSVAFVTTVCDCLHLFRPGYLSSQG